MPGPGAAWRGYLVFSGLSAGSKQAVVTVRDIKGNQAQRSVVLRFGVTPVIAIQSPLQYTVVRSTLRVTATCREGSQPCRTAEVRLASGGQSPVVLFSTSSGSIDRDVDVSAASGQPALLQIVGLGQSGITADARRTIYVEPSSALHELATVPGRVLDVLSGRVLWLDSTATVRAVRIRNVAAGTDVTPLTESGGGFLGGALTSTGAVFAFTAPGQNGRVHAFRNGSLTTVGGHGSASLQVTGDFAVWNEGETLKRYDASTGVATTVATDAGNTSNSVGPNGDVVYWTNGYQIVRVRGGTATPITSGPLPSVIPVTDGINIVFRQKGPDFQGPGKRYCSRGAISSHSRRHRRMTQTGSCVTRSTPVGPAIASWARPRRRRPGLDPPRVKRDRLRFSRAEACSRLWVRQDRSSSVPPLKVFPAASSRFRPTLQTPQT